VDPVVLAFNGPNRRRLLKTARAIRMLCNSAVTGVGIGPS